MGDRKTPLVTFWLESSEYAFDVFDVVEMMPITDLTRVPGAPAQVAGVTAWRGKTIPVVELGSLLKLGDRSPDVKKRLLVLGRPGPFAVLVDRPGRILRSEGALPVETTTAEKEAKEIMALFRTDQGLLRVLDPAQLIRGGSSRSSGPGTANRRESS